MARPRKKPTERLHALLRARCSQGELAAVKAQAQRAGLTLSQFVRLAVLNGERLGSGAASLAANDTAPKPALDPLHALVLAVNRAGNLVNQQMAIAHLRKELPTELLDADRALEAALRSITEQLGR